MRCLATEWNVSTHFPIWIEEKQDVVQMYQLNVYKYRKVTDVVMRHPQHDGICFYTKADVEWYLKKHNLIRKVS